MAGLRLAPLSALAFPVRGEVCAGRLMATSGHSGHPVQFQMGISGREVFDQNSWASLRGDTPRPALHPADVVGPGPGVVLGDVPAVPRCSVELADETILFSVSQEVPEVGRIGNYDILTGEVMTAIGDPIATFSDVADAAKDLEVPRVCGSPFRARHDVVDVQSGRPDAVVIFRQVVMLLDAVRLAGSVIPGAAVLVLFLAFLSAGVPVIMLSSAISEAFRPSQAGIILRLAFGDAAVPAFESVAAEYDKFQVTGRLVASLHAAVKACIEFWGMPPAAMNALVVISEPVLEAVVAGTVSA